MKHRRTQQHDGEQQVAPVDAVGQVPDHQRRRRAHRKECRRDVAAQVPAYCPSYLIDYLLHH